MPKGNEVISLFALEQKANELILMLHVGWREAGEKPHATHVEGEEQNNTPPSPIALAIPAPTPIKLRPEPHHRAGF